MEHYVLPEFSTVQEFLSYLARRTGKLKKGPATSDICMHAHVYNKRVNFILYFSLTMYNTGGIPDCTAAAKYVLHDWNTLVQCPSVSTD